jgi:hypothetical protein
VRHSWNGIRRDFSTEVVTTICHRVSLILGASSRDGCLVLRAVTTDHPPRAELPESGLHIYVSQSYRMMLYEEVGQVDRELLGVQRRHIPAVLSATFFLAMAPSVSRSSPTERLEPSPRSETCGGCSCETSWRCEARCCQSDESPPNPAGDQTPSTAKPHSCRGGGSCVGCPPCDGDGLPRPASSRTAATSDALVPIRTLMRAPRGSYLTIPPTVLRPPLIASGLDDPPESPINS